MSEVVMESGAVAEWGVVPQRWEQIVEYARALGPDPDLAAVDDGALEEAVRVQAAEIAAATARWLLLVSEFVVRGIWADHGARTPAEWLSWATGLAVSTSRDRIRTGLALRTWTATRERFLAGRLSYSKVRAITRCGYPELENTLLELSESAPASHLDRVVSGIRRCGRIVDDPPQARRRVDLRHLDDGAGRLVLEGPWEEVKRAWAVIDRLTETREDDRQPVEEWDDVRPANGRPIVREPAAARRFDAAMHAFDLAQANLDADTTGLDRHTLVLHADAEVLTGEPDEVEGPGSTRMVTVTDGGGGLLAMSRRVLRRIACDAATVVITRDGDGLPVDVGRRHRHLTAALRRAVRARDGTCRFPGCAATRHLHAHHIRHWADGGPTDLANLVLLCGMHHRYVHDHGWTITADHRGAFGFCPPGSDRPLRHVPETVTDVSAEALGDRIAQEGVEVGPRHLQPPTWYGERLDLDHAVHVITANMDRFRDPAIPLAA